MRSTSHSPIALRWVGPAAALLLLTAAPAAAQVACGDTITTDTTLQADLVCNVDPALTLVGPATFDMAGHTVTCTVDTDENGIRIEGMGATLLDGRVTHCKDGVNLRGSGHRVSGVESVENHDDGFQVGRTVTVGGHELVDNLAMANEDIGFEVDSDQNELVRNEAIDNGSEGFEMRGDDNAIVKNYAEGNETGFGVPPAGEGNAINNNEAHGNDRFGIRILGSGNHAAHNHVSENGEGGIQIVHGALENGVVANHVVENVGAGIKIEGCDNRVNANRVYETLADGEPGHGIWVALRLDALPDCTGEGNKLSGNRAVENAGAGILLDDGAVDNQVTGNKLDGNSPDSVVGDADANKIKGNKSG